MVAVDAAGADAALVLVPASDGHLLAEVGLGPLGPSLDLTRPSAAGDATGGLLRAVGGRGPSPTRTWRPGRPWAWPSRPPTWSG